MTTEQALPRISRAAAARLGRVARFLDSLDASSLVAAAQALFGQAPSLERRAPYPIARTDLAASCAEPLIAVALEHVAGDRRLVLEVDPSLAMSLLDRALGGAGAQIASGAPLRDVERGMFAYLAARLVSDAALPLVVRTVITTPLALSFALSDRDAVCTPYSCRVGGDRGVVRLWASELPDAPLRSPTNLPLFLSAAIGRGLVSAEDVASAREGDVLLLDEVWAHVMSGSLVGTVRLEVAGTTFAWEGAIREGSIVVGRSLVQTSAGHAEDRAMKETTVPRLEGAMFEARVEIARFTITAGELGQLREGEVLRTGVALGGEVAIRIGERAFATGELVDVEGEIGVRIARLERP